MWWSHWLPGHWSQGLPACSDIDALGTGGGGDVRLGNDDEGNGPDARTHGGLITHARGNIRVMGSGGNDPCSDIAGGGDRGGDQLAWCSDLTGDLDPICRELSLGFRIGVDLDTGGWCRRPWHGYGQHWMRTATGDSKGMLVVVGDNSYNTPCYDSPNYLLITFIRSLIVH
jgi:hypothetical protein